MGGEDRRADAAPATDQRVAHEDSCGRAAAEVVVQRNYCQRQAQAVEAMAQEVDSVTAQGAVRVARYAAMGVCDARLRDSMADEGRSVHAVQRSGMDWDRGA